MKIPTLSTIATGALAMTSLQGKGSNVANNQTATGKSLSVATTRNQLRGLIKSPANVDTVAAGVIIYPEGCNSVIGLKDNNDAHFIVESGTNGFCASLDDRVAAGCPGTNTIFSSKDHGARYDSSVDPRNSTLAYFKESATTRRFPSPLFAQVSTAGVPVNDAISACIATKFDHTVNEFRGTDTKTIPPGPPEIEEAHPNDDKFSNLQFGLTVTGAAVAGLAVGALIANEKNRHTGSTGGPTVQGIQEII